MSLLIPKYEYLLNKLLEEQKNIDKKNH